MRRAQYLFSGRDERDTTTECNMGFLFFDFVCVFCSLESTRPHVRDTWYLSSLSDLASLSIILPRSVHAVTNGKSAFFFYGQVLLHCVRVPQLFHPLVYARTLQWLPQLGCCKQCYSGHRGAPVLLNQCSGFCRCLPRGELAGHCMILNCIPVPQNLKGQFANMKGLRRRRQHLSPACTRCIDGTRPIQQRHCGHTGWCPSS